VGINLICKEKERLQKELISAVVGCLRGEKASKKRGRSNSQLQQQFLFSLPPGRFT
jgi:hypothetical protein